MSHTQLSEPLADGLADAARRLGISRGLIYKLHKAGKVKLVKLAGRTLITRTEQARLLAEATGNAIVDGGAAR
jgi:predicted site-specific integrase-resolvase